VRLFHAVKHRGQGDGSGNGIHGPVLAEGHEDLFAPFNDFEYLLWYRQSHGFSQGFKSESPRASYFEDSSRSIKVYTSC
jgi:hypothetical protein